MAPWHGGSMACVGNLFAASPLVLPCFPPQVVVTNVYFIQGLGFVVPQRTWNTFCCTTIYIQEPYFVKGCKDLDDFVCKAFIIVIHSELLNNQCEAKYQWLWPVWSQLEVFKSPTEHFLVPACRCKNQRHSWRHKIFNGHNFKN